MKGSRTNTNDTNLEVKTGTIRTAIYARCASGRPEDSNAAEQIRACTEYAQKQGWEVAGEFVQTDIGASGVSLTGCKSLMHLLEVAQRVRRPFDCVLVADISRLGRSLDRVTKLVNAFHGCGVFVQTVRGKFDSRNLHPGAWAAKTLLSCSPQYLQPTGRQCPMCGR
jgi:DNA invertase Pin-like site-specific DNA recombinase